ncbi:MAG: hypothetical protein OEW13_07475, partial [Nitrospira sp.]|nr:hypothetical protein [Nitrospira sp.]
SSSPRSFVSPPSGGVGEARLPLITLSEFLEPPLSSRNFRSWPIYACDGTAPKAVSESGKRIAETSFYVDFATVRASH